MTVDLGFVGEVAGSNVGVLDLLAEANIPVVASVGADERRPAYNVNADTVAGEIAAALRAEKIVFLTDVDGIYEDQGGEIDADLGVRPRLPRRTAGRRPHQRRHAAQGRRRAPCARGRRASAHIIDGRVEHAVLLEILTDAGCGTKVTA